MIRNIYIYMKTYYNNNNNNNDYCCCCCNCAKVKTKMSDENRYDLMMAGRKFTMAISAPENLINGIQTWRGAHMIRGNWSHAVCRLIRLGITYQMLLDEQAAERRQRKAEEGIPEEPKPKTPSKKVKSTKKKL
jgi:hypothetical protein